MGEVRPKGVVCPCRRAAAGGASQVLVQDRTVRGEVVRLERYDLAAVSREGLRTEGLRLVDSRQCACRNRGLAPEEGERVVIL